MYALPNLALLWQHASQDPPRHQGSNNLIRLNFPDRTSGHSWIQSSADYMQALPLYSSERVLQLVLSLITGP